MTAFYLVKLTSIENIFLERLNLKYALRNVFPLKKKFIDNAEVCVLMGKRWIMSRQQPKHGTLLTTLKTAITVQGSLIKTSRSSII